MDVRLRLDIIDKWKSIYNSRRRIDKNRFTKVINWLYTELLEMDSPKVIFCESIEAAITLRHQISSKPITDQIIEILNNRVYKPFGWLPVLDILHYVNTNENPCSRLSAPHNFEHAAYVEYYLEKLKCLGLKPSNVLEIDYYIQFKELLQSGAYAVYEYEEVVLAVHPPVKINLNRGRLHSLVGKAIEFSDGSGFYYFNGRLMSKSIYEKLIQNQFSIDDFLSIKDREIKSECMRYLRQRQGENAVYNFFRPFLKEVDFYIDEKCVNATECNTYRLYKACFKDFEMAYVSMFCPVMNQIVFLGVKADYLTAKDAFASLYRIPFTVKKYIKSISRQGVWFFTTFEEEAVEKLQDYHPLKYVTNIDGDEYFQKLKNDDCYDEISCDDIGNANVIDKDDGIYLLKSPILPNGKNKLNHSSKILVTRLTEFDPFAYNYTNGRKIL